MLRLMVIEPRLKVSVSPELVVTEEKEGAPEAHHQRAGVPPVSQTEIPTIVADGILL
jgi:hypothetical protein